MESRHEAGRNRVLETERIANGHRQLSYCGESVGEAGGRQILPVALEDGEISDGIGSHDAGRAPLLVGEWIEAWYNPRRRHSFCSMLSPADYEAAHWARRLETAA